MSTEYRIHKDVRAGLEISERSSRLQIGLTTKEATTWTEPMTPEQLVDVAVRMIQPALYNVSDPAKFYKEVILAKIQKLWV